MVRTTDWSFEAVFTADPISVSEARDFICRQMAAHELQHLVEDARLVVSELATNAVAHARTSFTLTVSRVGALVFIKVQDGSSAVPVKSTPGAMDIAGRGLLLTESLSHDWGAVATDNGSKAVWVALSALR